MLHCPHKNKCLQLCSEAFIKKCYVCAVNFALLFSLLLFFIILLFVIILLFILFLVVFFTNFLF